MKTATDRVVETGLYLVEYNGKKQLGIIDTDDIADQMECGSIDEGTVYRVESCTIYESGKIVYHNKGKQL